MSEEEENISVNISNILRQKEDKGFMLSVLHRVSKFQFVAPFYINFSEKFTNL